jgi:hypothetical protein
MKEGQMGEQIARVWDMRNIYKIFVGKPEGRKLLGRPKRRWKGCMRMDLQEIGFDWGLDPSDP